MKWKDPDPVCSCTHLKSEHLRYGSRTLDMANAYRECGICDTCKMFKKRSFRNG